MLSVDNRGKGVLSMGLFCEAFATLNVGVRVTITCHDLCNNRVTIKAEFGPRNPWKHTV